jgi:hypothetical protein
MVCAGGKLMISRRCGWSSEVPDLQMEGRGVAGDVDDEDVMEGEEKGGKTKK